ncbi:MAG TPA: type ISP restriction/modification enzyme [Allocoleopsis sp.]
MRETFRRPQQTSSIPFQPIDRKSSRTSAKTAQGRSHRKVDRTASKARSPFNQFSHSRDLAAVHYPITGSNVVEDIHYTEPIYTTVRGRIWINQTQYFDSVSPAVWNLVLGGRQICQKWLQERQGCILCEKSIQHYQQMLAILKDMVDLMSGIDTAMQAQQSHKPSHKQEMTA